ncbi:hypothetical protein [Rheinheimera baltica]|uniref:hypothetical protein n=1 Tax=Rheinheimera baltica TaxID=67576 RepID=UPI001969D8A8|nr:hypothetical protein [Rheinheimera baltica]
MNQGSRKIRDFLALPESKKTCLIHFLFLQVTNAHTITMWPKLVDHYSHHPKPLLINQSFLLFPHKMPDSVQLAALFNQQLQQFKQSGRYQTYFDRLAQGDYQ